jgi:predicted RNase H-like nuclease (RuvC/YqgF family)
MVPHKIRKEVEYHSIPLFTRAPCEENMAGKRPKPIGQLIIICYLFPLMLTLFFAQNSREFAKLGFAVSIIALSVFAMIIFLALKKWEQDWARRLEVAEKEESSKSKPVPAVKNEELERAKEARGALESEARELKAERETLQNREKAMRAENAALTAQLVGVQSELVAKTLDGKMQGEEIGRLRQEVVSLNTQITNLNFEMRTLLKLNGSSSRGAGNISP